MNRLKQVLATIQKARNEIQEAFNKGDKDNINNSIKLVDLALKNELNISLAIIADCMLEDKSTAGQRKKIEEKAAKIINNLCDQVEGCENCFYNNIGGKCSPMEFIDELEKGKE